MIEKLSNKQITFCRLFMEHGNATKAALEAGYSKQSAANAGCRLKAMPLVKAELDRLRVLSERDSIMTSAEASEHLTKLIRDKKKSDSIRISACTLLSKMRGWQEEAQQKPDESHDTTLKIEFV